MTSLIEKVDVKLGVVRNTNDTLFRRIKLSQLKAEVASKLNNSTNNNQRELDNDENSESVDEAAACVGLYNALKLYAIQSASESHKLPPEQALNVYRVTLHYTDSDGDKVMIGSDSELMNVLKVFEQQGVAKIMADVVNLQHQMMHQKPGGIAGMMPGMLVKRGPGRPRKKPRLENGMIVMPGQVPTAAVMQAMTKRKWSHTGIDMASLLPAPTNGTVYTPLEVVQIFESPAMQGKKIRSETYQYLIENDLVGVKNKRSIQKWIKDYRENPDGVLRHLTKQATDPRNAREGGGKKAADGDSESSSPAAATHPQHTPNESTSAEL